MPTNEWMVKCKEPAQMENMRLILLLTGSKLFFKSNFRTQSCAICQVNEQIANMREQFIK